MQYRLFLNDPNTDLNKGVYYGKSIYDVESWCPFI